MARAFIDAVSDGQFISARSLLALDLQKEISPQQLQNKWLGLQKTTGNFQAIEKVMEAEQGATAPWCSSPCALTAPPTTSL